MILLLDTSTPVCRLGIVADGKVTWHEWHADRELARGLLKYLADTLNDSGATLRDVTGIGVFQGPGSFTGLRIGLTVANTLAESLSVPIVGTDGEQWADNATERLSGGDNDRIVLPNYGGEANITKPRK